MILVRHLIARIGVSFSRLRTIRREVTRPVADALVCSYYVRCVSTPEILADVSVNHSRTGAVKLLITRRTSQSSKLSGVPFADYSCPGGRNWAAIQPRSKRMTRPCASRTLLSSCLRGQCRLTLWGTWTPGPSRRGPPRPFRRSQLCTLCWPALLRRPLAVRSRLGPNVDGVAGRIQRSELLPSRDALRLSNRARRTPVRGGVASATVANVGVGAFRRRGTAGFRRAACAHTGASMGL